MHHLNRRDFIRSAALALAAGAASAGCSSKTTQAQGDPKVTDPLFRISLAEWSLHRAILRNKTLDHLDFAKTAKQDFGIDAVEYVNQMFFDKAKDQAYLADMKKRAADQGVQSLLIMCDREGNLGDPDKDKRAKAVENHHKWADAASFLGCHSIRVNAASAGFYDEQVKLAADGLARLTDYCAKLNLNCIVENHGGLSSNGAWLAEVMKTVNNPRCGTLPDFGNFRIKEGEEYDRYKGVNELMPFAKGVSAKSHDFDAKGNETKTDYRRMLKLVCHDHKYRGHIGVEYEGNTLSEPDGIRATKKLLETVRAEL